jgi:Caspase domain
MSELPDESKKTSVQSNDVHNTEDIQFTPQDQLRSNVKLESNTGTALTVGVTAKKFYALVVGIEEYQDPSINSLDQPVKDAKSFYDVLVNYYTFEQGNIAFLVNPKREELTKALDKLVEKITPEDNLIIFYAGYGHWDEKLKHGYCLPSDAKSGDRGSWFSNADLKRYIGGINARHTLLITDACFGGGIFKTREAFHDANSDIQELYKYPSRKAMTSGSLNVVPDKSVFIEFLIKRMNLNYTNSEC